MAFVDVALAVGTFVGADALGAGAATLIGGGLLGAGAGGLYGGLTGGNVGKDMLYGGLLGAGGAYLGGAGAATTPAMETAQAGTLGGANSIGTVANAVANPSLSSLPAANIMADTGGMALPGMASGAVSAAGIGAGTAASGLASYLPTAKQAAMGLTAAALLKNATQNNVPTQLQQPNSNPMGLARLSPNFKGYQPNQPNPYYNAQYPNYVQNPYAPIQMAEGGLTPSDSQGTVEQMSRENAMGGNTMFPQSGIGGLTGANTYQNATNTPMGSNVIEPTDAITDPYTGQMKFASGGHLSSSPSIPDTGIFYDSDLTTKNLPAWNAAQAKYKQIAGRANIKSLALPKTNIEKLGGDFSDTGASGGIATLGSYSDGGHLLKGPGDGMSDNIPAQIGKHQPARLADGEFVVPADVVSHLGNGSTEAGAKKLYTMMDKVRQARTGKKAQGKQIKADKFLPT